VGRGTKTAILALCGVPLLLICLYSIVAIACRLWLGVPDTPWDAASVVEASRVASGLPLYEDPIAGHAMWVYGPVLPLLGGLLFRLTGPSTAAYELISVIAIAGVAAIASAVAWPGLTRFWRVICAISFVAIEAKVAFFGSVRPDCLGLFLATIALTLCYRGGIARYLIAAVVLSIAMMTKQQMAMFAVIPPIMALFEHRLRKPGLLLIAMIPSVVAVATLLAVRTTLPLAWFYMITVIAQYHVDPARLVGGFYLFAKSISPLVLVLGVATWFARPADPEQRRRIAWCAVTLVVTLTAGMVSLAKQGGAVNSLIPALFALVCLAWLLAGASIGKWQGTRYEMIFGGLFLLAFAASFKPVPLSYLPIAWARSGVRADFREVVARTRALKGSVLSPIDPTITLYARGQHDRTATLDMDVAGWRGGLPKALRAAYSTDYLIVKTGEFGVSELDFTHQPYRQVWRNKTYEIWQRLAPALVPAVVR
jgi:hypothetical protein